MTMERRSKKKDIEFLSHIKNQMLTVDHNNRRQITYQREQATRAYQNQTTRDIKSTTNRSNIIMDKFSPAADTLTAFVSSFIARNKELVHFVPANAQLKQVTDQCTKIVNHIFANGGNGDGFNKIHNWIHASNFEKTAVIEVVWNEFKDYVPEYVEGPLTGQEIKAIVSQREDQGLKVIIKEKIEMDDSDESGIDEDYKTYKGVKLEVGYEYGCIDFENCPPEEFGINETANKINDDPKTAYIERRLLVPKEYIMERFPNINKDKIMMTDGNNTLLYDYEKLNRHDNDGTWPTRGTADNNLVQLSRIWVKYDYNKDGMTEWRHVWLVGDMILKNEIWTGPLPFSGFSFFPDLHKFYGLSTYDKIHHLRRSSTFLFRSEFDHRNRQNTDRGIISKDAVNIKDLKSGKSGWIQSKRPLQPGDVQMLESGAGAGNTLQLLTYIDKQVDAIIGIGAETGAVSNDIEKSGNDATKTSMSIDNASAKIEIKVKRFVENLKDVARSIVYTLVENYDHDSVRDLVEMVTPGQPFYAAQPGMLATIMKQPVTANVGMGHVTSMQKQRNLAITNQTLQQLSLDPSTASFVTPQAKIKAGAETIAATGMDPTEFLPDAEQVPGMQQAMEQAVSQATQMAVQQVMEQIEVKEKEAKVAETQSKTEKNKVDMQVAQQEQQRKNVVTQFELGREAQGISTTISKP